MIIIFVLISVKHHMQVYWAMRDEIVLHEQVILWGVKTGGSPGLGHLILSPPFCALWLIFAVFFCNHRRGCLAIHTYLSKDWWCICTWVHHAVVLESIFMHLAEISAAGAASGHGLWCRAHSGLCHLVLRFVDVIGILSWFSDGIFRPIFHLGLLAKKNHIDEIDCVCQAYLGESWS